MKCPKCGNEIIDNDFIITVYDDCVVVEFFCSAKDGECKGEGRFKIREDELFR